MQRFPRTRADGTAVVDINLQAVPGHPPLGTAADLGAWLSEVVREHPRIDVAGRSFSATDDLLEPPMVLDNGDVLTIRLLLRDARLNRWKDWVVLYLLSPLASRVPNMNLIGFEPPNF